MKNAIIYTRVSTDEQAQKGYSLGYQREILEKHCLINGIKVLAHFQEDYSAKTFNRPEFNKLLDYVKKNKKEINLLLVVRWDRFSRNATDALNMIREMRNYGVSVESVEQNIDLSIPENKLMLMIFLTVPEIENDRRSLSTRGGMYKAMREGRWVSNPPIGYKISRDELNKPIIIPDEKAPLISELFEKFATGMYSQEELRRQYRKRGLNISKSHINRIFNNPAYIGKIRIPEFQKEQETVVEGLHIPIVEPETFAKVQSILNRSIRKGKLLQPKDENLPLRQHLICPNCNRKMTGSASKGNGGKYYYYHCQRGCNARFRADLMHMDFNLYLSQIKIDENISKLYLAILEDVFSQNSENNSKELNKIEKELEVQKQNLRKIDDKFINGEIEQETHKRLVDSIRDKMSNLEADKAEKSIVDSDFKNYLDFGFNLLSNLDKFYNEADLETKDKLLSSIFPEKLIYQFGNYRTNGNNDFYSLLGMNFQQNEGETEGTNNQNSCQSPNGSAYGDRTRTFRLERAAC